MISVIAYSTIYGQLIACETILPQVYGGSNKKIMGVYVQKGFNSGAFIYFLISSS